MPGEQLQISNDPSHTLANGLLWRISEATTSWKGDLLSTTRRESPMPFKAAAFTSVAGDQVATVEAEERVAIVISEAA